MTAPDPQQHAHRLSTPPEGRGSDLHALSVADRWYRKTEVGEGTTLITEPHVDVLMRANIWHIRGRDRDLLIDGGLGIMPLKPALPDPIDHRETIAFVTHSHLDHIGAIHEFEERWIHPVEAAALQHPRGSLVTADMDPELRCLFLLAGYPPLGKYLVSALPYTGYEPASFVPRGARPTRLMGEGEVIDLGDRQFIVLYVPGHSPGSLALFEEATGILFAGDVIYDGPLLYQGPGMNVEAYLRSFDLLSLLPISVVHAGRGPSFGKTRLNEIIARYRTRWRAEGLLVA